MKSTVAAQQTVSISRLHSLLTILLLSFSKDGGIRLLVLLPRVGFRSYHGSHFGIRTKSLLLGLRHAGKILLQETNATPHLVFMCVSMAYEYVRMQLSGYGDPASAFVQLLS